LQKWEEEILKPKIRNKNLHEINRDDDGDNFNDVTTSQYS